MVSNFNKIADLSKQLSCHVKPVGLSGVFWCTAIGAGLCAALGFSTSFAGVLTHMVPGLAPGLFVGIFLGSILIGVVMQWRARRVGMQRPEVKAIAANLELIKQELKAIPEDLRTEEDKNNLLQVHSLETRMDWTFKQCLRQIGFGFIGLQPYLTGEELVCGLFRKMKCWGRGEKRNAPLELSPPKTQLL